MTQAFGRHVGVESGVEWSTGPAGDGAKSLGRLEQESILVSLAGEPARRLKPPGPGELGWIGLPPAGVYGWLTEPARSH